MDSSKDTGSQDASRKTPLPKIPSIPKLPTRESKPTVNENVVRRDRPLAKGTDAVAPLTWDQNTPPPAPPPVETGNGTERTELVDPASSDFGVEAEAERTVVTGAAYELRPRFTGRQASIAKLQELVDAAFEKKNLAFAVITGEPGMGKSRMVAELVARARTMRAQDVSHLVLVPKAAYHPDFCLVDGRVRNQPREYTFGNYSILRPELFANCRDGAFPIGPLWHAAADADRVSGEVFHGRWWNLGTPQQVVELEAEINAQRRTA